MTYVLLSLGLSSALAQSTSSATTTVNWAKLNQTVGGRLGVATPYALSCFSKTSTGLAAAQNSQQCATAQANNANHRESFFYRVAILASWWDVFSLSIKLPWCLFDHTMGDVPDDCSWLSPWLAKYEQCLCVFFPKNLQSRKYSKLLCVFCFVRAVSQLMQMPSAFRLKSRIRTMLWQRWRLSNKIIFHWSSKILV